MFINFKVTTIGVCISKNLPTLQVGSCVSPPLPPFFSFSAHARRVDEFSYAAAASKPTYFSMVTEKE
jgi:hypothetical protein